MQVVIAQVTSYSPPDYLVLAGHDLDHLSVKGRYLSIYDARARVEELEHPKPILTEDELTQLKADQAVLLLAIERGYLTNDDAAALQLDI